MEKDSKVLEKFSDRHFVDSLATFDFSSFLTINDERPQKNETLLEICNIIIMEIHRNDDKISYSTINFITLGRRYHCSGDDFAHEYSQLTIFQQISKNKKQVHPHSYPCHNQPNKTTFRKRQAPGVPLKKSL